ncbi:hypothetical protein ScPMuIL_000091 [Solemya velum]
MHRYRLPSLHYRIPLRSLSKCQTTYKCCENVVSAPLTLKCSQRKSCGCIYIHKKAVDGYTARIPALQRRLCGSTSPFYNVEAPDPSVTNALDVRTVENNVKNDHRLEYGDSLEFDFEDKDEANSYQTGGAAKNKPLGFVVEKINQRTFKNLAVDHHYRVRFNSDQTSQNVPLMDIYESLGEMFDTVLGQITPGFRETDLIRVIIHHDALTNPIFIPLRAIGELPGAKIIEYLMNVLSSNQSFAVNASFYLEVGVIRLPAGGRGRQSTT